MTLQKVVLAIVTSAALTATAAAVAQSKPEHHQHHQHHPRASADSAATAEAPPIEILMPGNGDTVGRQLAVVLRTPADLDAMTMSAASIGVHLHVDLDGLSLMPTRQQLIDLGSQRYLFMFDLPAEPGERVIKVYWSDALHRTMESTMRTATVTVR